MTQAIAPVSLLIHNYDKAIALFTQALRFALVEKVRLYLRLN